MPLTIKFGMKIIQNRYEFKKLCECLKFKQGQCANTYIVSGFTIFTSKNIEGKIWLTLHGRMSVVAKRTMNTNTVLYCIFVSCNCIALQFRCRQPKKAQEIYSNKWRILPMNYEIPAIEKLLTHLVFQHL